MQLRKELLHYLFEKTIYSMLKHRYNIDPIIDTVSNTM